MNIQEVTNFINQNAPAVINILFYGDSSSNYWCIENLSESGRVIMMQCDETGNETWGGMRGVELETFINAELQLIKKLDCSE